MGNAEKEKCFIITPIGEDTDPIRRHIDGIIDAAIIPALSDKYEIQAAHHISKPGSITKQVIEAIYNAKLVVANLTGRNPNVMYELALRHAIGKPAIMIVERGTSIPSDIIMQRTIPYYNDAKGVLELQDDLKKAEAEISFEDKGGPIFDVLGDISHDTDMLKKAAENNAEIMDPLEYIMRRLDRIENSFSNSQSTFDQQITLNHSGYMFTYTFSSTLPFFSIEKTHENLIKRIKSRFNLRVYNFEASIVRKTIEFMIDFSAPMPLHLFDMFVLDILKDNGCIGVYLSEYMNLPF